MNGRLENELKAEEKMKNKLRSLPPIFSEFYAAMAADGKTYTTIPNYINHNVDFMRYVTNNNVNNTFYTCVTPANINNYMIMVRVW